MSNIGLLPVTNQGLRVGSNGDLMLGASLDSSYNKTTIVVGKNNQLHAFVDNALVLGNNNIIQSSPNFLNNNNIVLGSGCWISRNTSGSSGNSGGNIVIGQNASTGALNGANVFVGGNVVIGGGASASATQGVAIGASSTSAGGVAIGVSTSATGVAIGTGSVASGTTSIAIGGGTVSNAYAIILNAATSRTHGDFHVAAASLSNCQWGVIPVGITTTDATQTELWSWFALSARCALPNNSLYAFQGYLTARNSTNNDAAVWFVQGAVKRTANAASTAIVGTPTSTQIAVDSGASTWSYVLDANTTNGALRFRVTGAAATNITWYIALSTTEVT